MVCRPAPAIPGKKLPALTPTPIYVPPNGIPPLSLIGWAFVVVTGSQHEVNVTTGKGSTVMITELSVPVQPFATGVVAYVTVSIVKPVLTRVCWITLPLPDEKPVTFGELPVAIQVKVDPRTCDWIVMFDV